MIALAISASIKQNRAPSTPQILMSLLISFFAAISSSLRFTFDLIALRVERQCLDSLLHDHAVVIQQRGDDRDAILICDVLGALLGFYSVNGV